MISNTCSEKQILCPVPAVPSVFGSFLMSPFRSPPEPPPHLQVLLQHLKHVLWRDAAALVIVVQHDLEAQVVGLA